MRWLDGISDSVQFSLSVVSDSLRPHELQHARPPCPSPTPRVCQVYVFCIGDATQPSHSPLLSSFSSSIFLSTRVFSFNFAYYFKSESASHSVVSDSLQPHGPYGPRDSSGQNTEVGSLSLLQGIFLTQELNLGLLHCRQILY